MSNDTQSDNDNNGVVVLFEGEIGEYLCEDLDVSDFETLHVDSNGRNISITGRVE